MWQVVNSPINLANYELFSPCKWVVAGKTGTAQKGENIANDAMFICFAPYRTPEVAVSVVVERGGAGADVAFIARNILDAYITIRGYSDSSEPEMALLK